jgi:predicted nicotinamide N-methyase
MSASPASCSLTELKRRVDALFKSAEGRVGPGHEELARFCQRLNGVTEALLREVAGEKPQKRPRPDDAPSDYTVQRRDTIVCNGSWEAQRGSVAELEAETGERAYTSLEVTLAGPHGAKKLRVRQFAEYYFSSGSRVWDSSVPLARWLYAHPSRVRGRHVLELGAGVGLPGLASIIAGASRVRLTDNEPNLLANLRHNAQAAVAGRAREDAPVVEVEALDWSGAPEALRSAHGAFDVVLGSDIVYSSGCVAHLVRALSVLLKPTGFLVVAAPTGRYGQREFAAALSAAGMECTEEPVDPALLAGCAHQGTEAEVLGHAFTLLHARPRGQEIS